jgi:hypothetical protein
MVLTDEFKSFIKLIVIYCIPNIGQVTIFTMVKKKGKDFSSLGAFESDIKG